MPSIQRLGERTSSLRRGVRRAVLRRRRLLAALLVSIAVAAGIRAVTAEPPSTYEVQVAARDLPAGTPLRTGDLQTRSYLGDNLPDGLVDDPVGQRLATPMGRGEPITRIRLSGEALLESYPLLSAVPLRIPDADAAALLAPGDLVDVLATDPQGGGSRLLLEQAPVLAMPEANASGQDTGPLGGRLVVLGVPPGLRAEVADATVGDFLSLSLSS